jgi:putative oxidoreductase
MDALPKLGRWLFALPMGVFGLMHFMAGPAMAGMVPIPGGVLWVYATGVALIAATVAIVTGKQALLAAQLLAVFLLLTALTVHLPALLGGDQNAMGQVLKDLALAGGALVLAGVLAGEARASVGSGD